MTQITFTLGQKGHPISFLIQEATAEEAVSEMRSAVNAMINGGNEDSGPYEKQELN